MRLFQSLKSLHSRSHTACPLHRFSTLLQPDGLYYFAVNKPYNVASQFTTDPGSKRKSLTLKSLGVPRNDCYPASSLDAESEGLLLLSNDKRFLTQAAGADSEYLVQVDLVSHVKSGSGDDMLSPTVDESLQRLLANQETANPSTAFGSGPGGAKATVPGLLRLAEVHEEAIEGNIDPPPAWSVVSTFLWPEEHVRRRKRTPTQILRLVVNGQQQQQQSSNRSSSFRGASASPVNSSSKSVSKDRQIRKLLASAGLPVLRLVRTRVGEFNLFSHLHVLGEPGAVCPIEAEDVAGNANDRKKRNQGDESGPVEEGTALPTNAQGDDRRQPHRRRGRASSYDRN